MTVSVNTVPELKRDVLLETAIRLTGMLPDEEDPTAKQLSLAAIHLNLTLEMLQAEGIVLSTVERRTLPLVAGQKEYTLPADTLDVELGQDDTLGTIRDQAGTTETIVRTMSRGEYQQLAVKDSVISRPARGYVERQLGVKIVFWPIPDATMVSFNYAAVRFFRAFDDGTVTPDLVRTWTLYLVYAVAAPVALSNSLVERGQYLQARADALLEKCKAGDVQHGAIQLRVGHNARNW